MQSVLNAGSTRGVQQKKTISACGGETPFITTPTGKEREQGMLLNVHM